MSAVDLSEVKNVVMTGKFRINTARINTTQRNAYLTLLAVDFACTINVTPS